jgi:membrane associated rhomboid family serine protease
MVFPVGTDESEHHTTPFVTYLLIIANVAAFIAELNLGDAFIKHWAFTPAEFFNNPAVYFPTLLTSMFLHGGWLHLIGNMAYLWSFGDNVEDNFGHLPFLVFYIVAGILAMFAQAAFLPHSNLPNLGASGAIAGVLGAYIVMFPRGTVRLLTNAGIVHLPAFLAIGGWIALRSSAWRVSSRRRPTARAAWLTWPISAGSLGAWCWRCCSAGAPWLPLRAVHTASAAGSV